MPGLYSDENFPIQVVAELRGSGFDVLTMYEDRKANQSLTDEEVLSIASEKDRALLTAIADTSSGFIGDYLITAALSFALSIRILSVRHNGSQFLNGGRSQGGACSAQCLG